MMSFIHTTQYLVSGQPCECLLSTRGYTLDEIPLQGEDDIPAGISGLYDSLYEGCLIFVTLFHILS